MHGPCLSLQMAGPQMSSAIGKKKVAICNTKEFLNEKKGPCSAEYLDQFGELFYGGAGKTSPDLCNKAGRSWGPRSSREEGLRAETK